MRLLALLVLLLSSPAMATDYELSATSYAALLTGLYAKGFAVGPSAINCTIKNSWTDGQGDSASLMCYNQKYINGVLQSGAYCVVRWIGPNAPPAITGVTLNPLPTNSPYVFF